MLPAVHRMRRSPDFEAAVRRGRRAGRRTLVVHVAPIGHSDGRPNEPSVEQARHTGRDRLSVPSRVGFVVSRTVGSSVVRSRVKRRLRAVLAARLDLLPEGLLVVVRANPAAAGVSSAQLAADVEVALGRALKDRSGPKPATMGDGAGRAEGALS